MPCISQIQNCSSYTLERPASFSISEVGFSFATLAIGGVGIFLLTTQTLVPLGISLTVISGTGALGVVTFAIFRRCCGSSETGIEEVDEESHSKVEKKSQLEEKEVDSSYEFAPGEAEETAKENPKDLVLAEIDKHGKQEEEKESHVSPDPKSPVLFIGENAILLARTPLERELIRHCQNHATGLYPADEIADKLIPIFKKMSYEEIQRCFSLVSRDRSWFRWDENPQKLPPKRVIGFSLIEKLLPECSNDPQWVEALITGVEDEKEIAEIVWRAENSISGAEIGLDSPQGRMLLILRKKDRVISILQHLQPMSLSHVVANLSDAELIQLLSLFVEFNSEALATKEQIEKENALREQKIQRVIHAIADYVWKSLDTHGHRSKKLETKEIDRSWAQLKEALTVLVNVPNQFGVAMMEILKTMDERLSGRIYKDSPEEVLEAIEIAEKGLETLVKEINPHPSKEFITAFRETFWQWRVEEVPSFIKFPGPFTARMAIRYAIWAEKEEGFQKVSNRINNKDWLRWVIPVLSEEQLVPFLKLFDIETTIKQVKEDPTDLHSIRRCFEINAAIFAGLSIEQREKYFPGYQLEISEINGLQLKKKKYKVDELDGIKQITDK